MRDCHIVKTLIKDLLRMSKRCLNKADVFLPCACYKPKMENLAPLQTHTLLILLSENTDWANKSAVALIPQWVYLDCWIWDIHSEMKSLWQRAFGSAEAIVQKGSRALHNQRQTKVDSTCSRRAGTAAIRLEFFISSPKYNFHKPKYFTQTHGEGTFVYLPLILITTSFLSERLFSVNFLFCRGRRLRKDQKKLLHSNIHSNEYFSDRHRHYCNTFLH